MYVLHAAIYKNIKYKQCTKIYIIAENNIPMAANKWKHKLFVCVPRRRNGILSTLNYINLNEKDRHDVPLIPYPRFDINQLDYTGEDRIVSVYRIHIDVCDRIWMVDTGIIEIPGNFTL